MEKPVLFSSFNHIAQDFQQLIKEFKNDDINLCFKFGANPCSHPDPISMQTSVTGP